MWQSVAYVAMGGAAGSVTRHLLVQGAARVFGAGSPPGVLMANVAGSFAVGWLAQRLAGQGGLWHPLLITGFLGGFTTFSAFSLDTLRFWESGQPGLALAYVLGSVLLSLVAVALGAFAARGWA